MNAYKHFNHAMDPLDWLMVALSVVLVLGFGAYTRRLMKSVADFVAGGRLAGPYLLAVSRGEMQAGAVVFVAAFEVVTKSGFTLQWWGAISTPFVIVVAISGFVVYRFRETRAMTLAQFFEMRYSNRFRLFAGGLAFFAGLLNFGIIPAVGARCMVFIFGLPQTFQWLGVTWQTSVVLMAVLLTVTVFITLGGMTTLMITDCIEGMITQVFYLIIIAALLFMFDWGQIIETLSGNLPGQSKLNPFDSAANEDFNVYFVLMGILLGVYGTMAWQNSSGFNAAARTPHTAVMGGLLGRWRDSGKSAVIALLAVCALTFLQHPDFAAASAGAHATIDSIADSQTQSQMRVPVALNHLLPVGVLGVFASVLLLGIFGGDSTHLHSWSGIFVQDLIVPLRKRPLTPKGHIRVLRLAIIGVALFAFCFGALFQQTEYIFMWWAVTQAIFVGGAGAAIIGGLYWKKGTAPAAYAAMIAGVVLSLGGIVMRQIYPEFPLNGVEIAFYGMFAAVAIYVVVSLLTCKEDHDMDRLLHRGSYAIKTDLPEAESEPRPPLIVRIIGIGKEFTKWDKVIAVGLFAWTMLWVVVLIIGSAWNAFFPLSDEFWASYWHVVGIGIPVFLCFVTAIWFTSGGVRDIRQLFTDLRREQVDALDDGTVVNHRNLNEVAGPSANKDGASGSSGQSLH
jgi:SSS family solute:Na+ symporter